MPVRQPESIGTITAVSTETPGRTKKARATSGRYIGRKSVAEVQQVEEERHHQRQRAEDAAVCIFARCHGLELQFHARVPQNAAHGIIGIVAVALVGEILDRDEDFAVNRQEGAEVEREPRVAEDGVV